MTLAVRVVPVHGDLRHEEPGRLAEHLREEGVAGGEHDGVVVRPNLPGGGGMMMLTPTGGPSRGDAAGREAGPRERGEAQGRESRAERASVKFASAR